MEYNISTKQPVKSRKIILKIIIFYDLRFFILKSASEKNKYTFVFSNSVEEQTVKFPAIIIQ